MNWMKNIYDKVNQSRTNPTGSTSSPNSAANSPPNSPDFPRR